MCTTEVRKSSRMAYDTQPILIGVGADAVLEIIPGSKAG